MEKDVCVKKGPEKSEKVELVGGGLGRAHVCTFCKEGENWVSGQQATLEDGQVTLCFSQFYRFLWPTDHFPPEF